MSESGQAYNPFTYQFSFSQLSLPFLKDKLQYEPTEVLLFKKVPYNATELDLIYLCKPFGQIEDLCFLKNKGYAFVQFKEPKMAQLCYETMKCSEPTLKGSRLYVFYTGKHDLSKNEGYSSSPSRFVLVSLTSLAEEINPEIIESLLLRYGKPVKMTRLQEVPYNAIIEMNDLEEGIRLKEELHNFEITKVSRISATYVSGKLCNLGESNTPKIPKFHMMMSNRNCTSLENSTVASPVFHSGESSLDTFSDGLGDSFFSISRKDSEEGSPRTVMVKNLPKNTTCDDLFKLFGMYGNISKAKIFFKNPEAGLVQFQESYQAGLARKFLNNCPIQDTMLSVSLSKTDIATSVSENNDFFKDYTMHKGQRYRKVGSKNFRNIAQPSKVLHLSNLPLPPDQELEFYKDLVSSCGTVVNSMVLQGETQNLLIELQTIGEAVDTLVKYHNFKIEGKFLKVSFSKYESIKYL